MTWIKIDDGAFGDPRLLALPRGLRLLHFEALAWSGRYSADGRIPRHVVERLTDEPAAADAAEELVAAGLWEDDGDGWRAVWLLDDQPTAEEAQRQRAAAAERQRRKRRHDAGDHSLCDRCWFVNKQGKKGTGVTGDVTRDVTDSRSRESQPPVPSRPAPPSGGGDGEKREVGAGRAQAPAPPPHAEAIADPTPEADSIAEAWHLWRDPGSPEYVQKAAKKMILRAGDAALLEREEAAR